VGTTVPKEEIRTIVASLTGIPAMLILWDGEPVPFSGEKNIVLNVTGRRAIGVDEERREYPTADTTRISLVGQRAITISVRADNFGTEEAFDLLETLRVLVGQDSVRESFRTAGVAFTDATNVQTLNVNVDNRAISVASLDLFFNQTVETVVDINASGYIETVEMTGEDDLALAETFEVIGSS